MINTAEFLAVDIGASGGRVLAASWNGSCLSLSQLHTFPNRGIRVHGSLYWDVLRLWEEIQDGMRHYGVQKRRSPISIGIDSWGVDYALIASNGQMLANPHHYRDNRTEGVPPKLYEVISEPDLFQQTGIQPLPINTIFQLYSMVLSEDPLIPLATSLLTIPDLFNYFLTGERCTEPTIASTTQMLGVFKNRWCKDIAGQLRIPVTMLPEIIPTGAQLPVVREDIRQHVGLVEPFRAVAIASHDTASAVLAIPELTEQSAFISCGTWSLIGTERERPILTEEARKLGFSNERSATGKYLFLKNVTGLWLLQECQRIWMQRGRRYTWDDLVEMAEQVEALRSQIDPNASEFVAPADMSIAIQKSCAKTGQHVPQNDAEITRCCMESLALTHRSIIASMEKMTATRVRDIRMVGGGSQNRLLCQLTADATGLPVISGPTEASVIGNVMTQVVASGEISDCVAAKDVIATSFDRITYLPKEPAAWNEAEVRWRQMKAQHASA